VANYIEPGTTSADAAACVAPPTELALTKSGPGAVDPEGVITWTLVVTNTGTTTSSGFSVTDTFPSTVTDVATTTPGCSVAGNTVTCSGGVLPAGGTFTITVTGRAPPSGCVTNTATVLGNESTGPVVSNSLETCVVPLLLVKAADTTFVTAAGDAVVYSFTVQNTSTVTISNIAVTDTPPSHAAQLGTITCTPNPLPAGQTATCTAQFPYSATGDDVAAGEILNTATATGIYSGTLVESNPWSVSVDVRPPQPPGTAALVNSGNVIGVRP
jgi:uncharacterized repeat protein (TIGR01451 family)